jgi:hypothetical protein
MHSNPSDDLDGVVRELRNARHIVSKNLALLRRVDVSKLTPEYHSRHDTKVTTHCIALRILAPNLPEGTRGNCGWPSCALRI